MDEKTILILVLCGIAGFIIWLRSPKQDEDVVQKALQAARNVSSLRVIPKQGRGFTQADNEIQLVNDKLSILYTPTKRDDGAFIETAHIMLGQVSFVTITRVDSVVTVIGGNQTNFRDPDLPSNARFAITQIFQTIAKTAES